jgi:hypothetical protein
MAAGVVCTCSSDQTLQSVQQSVHNVGAAVAVLVEVWRVPWLAVSVLLFGWLLVIDIDARGRASPELLQRFLF